MWIIKNLEGHFLVYNEKRNFIFSQDNSQIKEFESERHCKRFLYKWKKNKRTDYIIEFYTTNKRKGIK